MEFTEYSYRIGHSVKDYDIADGGLYASKWDLTDLYPECEKNLKALLESGEDFRCEWGAKKELLSVAIMRINRTFDVSVSAWMDELWDSDDLIYDALFEVTGSECEILSDETIEEIRNCLSDECDDNAGESFIGECDSYEELMNIINNLATYAEARLDAYFSELVSVVREIAL